MKMEETKRINAILVFDIIGKPPEHLTETLNDIIKKIGEEKGVSVKETKVNEPVFMKDQKEFYTSFAEVEVEVEEILYLGMLMFKYMPAHIEVISPELITLANNGWNEIFNELVRRLHGYDEVARVIQMEKGVLEKKLKEALGENKNQEDKKTEEKKGEEENDK